MDIFVTRQPIFDRNMQVFGYELLCNNNNDLSDRDKYLMSAELLYNSFFVVGIDDLTDRTIAFINFSKDLISSDVPLLLPARRIIVEIHERDKTFATVENCKKIKKLGFTLALDGFILDDDNISLLGIADFVNIEYPLASYESQKKLINKFKSKVKFLASNIETREDYSKAAEIGYDLFKGNFFSTPSTMNSKEIETLNMTLFNIIQELNSAEPRFSVIADIIEHDVGMSYKLLKLVNSAYIAPWHKIKSIPQALVFLGTRELHQWISLMMLHDLTNIENAELVRLSLVRGKLMSLLAQELNYKEESSEYFFTGIFSLIDILLHKNMQSIMAELPLPIRVKQALLGENNDIRKMLNLIIDYENARWNKVFDHSQISKIGPNTFVNFYLSALKWAQILDH